MRFYFQLLAFLFGAHLGSAQASIVSAGGDAVGSGGSVSYSIGQVSIDYTTGSNASIQEGVQQPFEISQVSVHESMSNILLSIFPNPALNELNIRMSQFESGLTATIRDSKGTVVKKIGLKTANTSIETGDWAQAIYFIEIANSAGHASLYRLVKN